MGMGNLVNFLEKEDVQVLAVCDVDKLHLKQAMELVGNGVDGYSDFRELLARPDIDIVHIATPPHWHGLMSIAAAEAGKDIWCEKWMLSAA